jgi:hypothetical protein
LENSEFPIFRPMRRVRNIFSLPQRLLSASTHSGPRSASIPGRYKLLYHQTRASIAILGRLTTTKAIFGRRCRNAHGSFYTLALISTAHKSRQVSRNTTVLFLSKLPGTNRDKRPVSLSQRSCALIFTSLSIYLGRLMAATDKDSSIMKGRDKSFSELLRQLAN